MSKIQSVRLINVNYNNNAIRISDECFHLNGESTLLSLRNGGGKSVLVQMMTAPFVHKRYRDAKDRPFESYFTTNKPSFILVEWALDQGAGYVLTGMMVRRSQDVGEGNGESLDMVNIISEYQAPCIQDISHLPVIEKGKKEIVLKNFTACRQLFESYKKDRSMKFFYYDMTNSAQSRQYFDKLAEYQIHYKEWETIIKKVNLKESGLSDLFADCKDEKGLVEKWFLDAVESKLDKEQNRMKEFRSILGKYVGQYKENQTKIRRRNIIQAFKEEAAGIQEAAQSYQDVTEEEQAQKNLVAHFILELNRLHEETEGRQREVKEEIESVRRSIARVEYEKLSVEIHQLEEEKRFHLSNREMIEIEKEDLLQEAERIGRALHLMLCAKQQKTADQEWEELVRIRQKLLVSRKKEEDLGPERNYLGYRLRRYYERMIAGNEADQADNDAAYRDITERLRKEEEKLKELAESMIRCASRQGGLRSAAASYDKQEESYNQRYGEELLRNILGVYEPGALEIRKESYEKELEGEIRTRLSLKKQQAKNQERRKSLERILEDMKSEQIRKRLESQRQEEIGEGYKRELEARRSVLQYLNLEETALFDTDKILRVSERKLQELAGLRRSLEKEEDKLQKEYQGLTQGKVLDLPEELEREFANMGIHVVYGMEWLSKNGYSEEKNRELVRRHPFLPYALILSEAEIQRLSQGTGGVCTSFPIPIVLREMLEGDEENQDGRVIHLKGISFYVLFNDNLLNEEKLQALVEEKEREIRRKKEAIAIREKEYAEYFERQELIRNQTVSKEKWETNLRKIESLKEESGELARKIRGGVEELAGIQDEAEQLEQKIRETEKEAARQQRRMEDFERLRGEYESYEQNLRELERCRKEEEKLAQKQKLAQNQREKLRDEQKTKEIKRADLLRAAEELKENVRRYRQYEEAGQEESSGDAVLGAGQEESNGDAVLGAGQEEDIREMEARYAAITASMSLEIQELEEQEHRAAGRHQEMQDELLHLQRKYGFSGEEWLKITYNREEEAHQEIMLEDRRRKIEVKQRLWNDADKKAAVVSQRKKERMERMLEECNEEEPLPKEEIRDQDFDARKNHFRYQEKEAQKQADRLTERLRSYDENLTALAEYSDFPLGEEVEWEQDFAETDSRGLRNFKGILIRDYNQCLRKCQEARDRLVRILNRAVRMEQFQEEFYKKPLETMLELSGDASAVLRQLSTILQSYDNLMEKLKIDIALVEKEKNKIVELLEDYVREVHMNLAKIDHNSTITIRERPVKMLKLKLPEWEENENLYQIRLQDMVDEITQKGILLFEQNENAQEYFGTRITTRNLYDTVVGVGNVQIRLYKIEEQREYPITWAEVARNSGGEGFLSAFVVLSSLLYYMRRDDTDLFADRNEGKVLLMDNPFAQTNAAHLLKPLMDMAKKTNTQLICLTGLGGESIYNRFDNIYVLNLIAASLRSGMQYLKADHMRGNEPETMIVSQIEVMEQQELVF